MSFQINFHYIGHCFVTHNVVVRVCSLIITVRRSMLFKSGQVGVFNVHIQSKLLQRTPVTGTCTGTSPVPLSGTGFL